MQIYLGPLSAGVKLNRGLRLCKKVMPVEKVRVAGICCFLLGSLSDVACQSSAYY
jgi:hypothetical protein